MKNTLIVFTLISLISVGCTAPEEDLNLQGIKYAESGDYQQALEYFDEAIQLNQNNSDYFNNRGNAYYGLEQYVSAQDDYAQAIRLAPGYYLPYMNLGSVYDALGVPEQAIKMYSHAIELGSDHPEPYRNRGITHMHIREFGRALSDLNFAIELDPEYVPAYAARSLTHAALSQYAEATLDYAHVMDVDPEQASRITNVGIFKQINVAPDLAVSDSMFGTWHRSGDPFIRTGRVPLIEGQSYGWFLTLNTRREIVRFREEFRLPHASETWGAGENVRISQSRQIAITEKEVDPDKDNVIGNYWNVAEGDPEGLYMMNIFIEDKAIETFIFWVGK